MRLHEIEQKLHQWGYLSHHRDAEHDVAWLLDQLARYLQDLRGALETDTDRARQLLAKMLGKVTLRRDGARLLADLRGNLPGLVDVDQEVFGRAGAGSPEQMKSEYPWPSVVGAVA